MYKKNWLARQGKKWTERDMTTLLDLYASGARWGVIADQLQRSIPSCVDRLRALRFYHGFRKVFKHKSETYKVDKLEIKGRVNNVEGKSEVLNRRSHHPYDPDYSGVG